MMMVYLWYFYAYEGNRNAYNLYTIVVDPVTTSEVFVAWNASNVWGCFLMYL